MSFSNHNLRWRLAWTSLLGLLLAGYTFFLFQWRYGFVDDHCLWKAQNAKVFLTEVLPGGVAEKAGLRDGDELLEIDQVPCQGPFLMDLQGYINSKPVDRILVYKARRFDPEMGTYRTVYAPVRVVKPFHYRMFITLLAGLAAWAVGLLVVLYSPLTKIALHFYYLCLTSLLLIIVMPGNMIGNCPKKFMIFVMVMEFLIYAWVSPLWVHFFLKFPYPFPWHKRKRIVYTLYIVFATLALFLTMPRFIEVFGHHSNASFLLKHRPVFLQVRNILIGTYMLVGVLIFWIGLWKLDPKAKRALLPSLLFTTFIFVEIVAYSNFHSYYEMKTLTFSRISWIFFVPLPLLPISFAYAILKHGLFDIQAVFVRWASYFLVLAFGLGIYLLLLAWLFSNVVPFLRPAHTALLLGVAALPMGWLLRWLLRVLRRKFYKDLDLARDKILTKLHATTDPLSEEALIERLETGLREAFLPRLLQVVPVVERRIMLPGVTAPCEIPESLLERAQKANELVFGLDLGPIPGLDCLVPLQAQVMLFLMLDGEVHTVVLLSGKYAELNYSVDDRQMLNEVTLAASTLLKTIVLHKRLLNKQRMEQELQMASSIQRNFVSEDAPSIPGFKMAMRMDAALETGGDLLWVKQRPNGRWVAAVGDVSGKGLPAALYMCQATALLKVSMLVENLTLEEGLTAMDCTMRGIMDERSFITLLLVEWDESGCYRLARGGHLPALKVSGSTDAHVQPLSVLGRGLGLRPEKKGNWKILEGRLAPGEWLVMFSDGLTEAMNDQGEVYGTSRLIKQLQSFWSNCSVEDACEAVFRDVASFCKKNRDDQTLFILGRDAV